MASRARKLLIVQEHDPTVARSPVSHSVISSNTLSPIVRTKNNEDYYVSSSYGGLSGYRLNPPFDASMALTVFVLLIAVFLMGFFSFYIRRFANDSSVDQSRRYRRRFASSLSSYAAAVGSPSPNGVDPDTVDSLPVYSYRETAKQEIDCTICLSEFEEGEVVKVIPFCGHVFHVDCIDTWLSSHVTCPLCRTAKLFPPAKEAAEESGLAPAPEEVRVVIRCDAGGAHTVGGSGSTVDERDTWNACVGPGGLRRSSSCLLSGGRVVVLRRSFSF